MSSKLFRFCKVDIFLEIEGSQKAAAVHPR